MRKLLLVGLMLLTSITTFAQISGKVIDHETGDVLPGKLSLLRELKMVLYQVLTEHSVLMYQKEKD